MRCAAQFRIAATVMRKERKARTKRDAILFVPIVNVISNYFHHDRTFWGIRFPVGSFSADQTVVNVVQKYLERSRNAVLKTCVEGLDQPAVALAVVIKIDREFIEHKMRFFCD